MKKKSDRQCRDTSSDTLFNKIGPVFSPFIPSTTINRHYMQTQSRHIAHFTLLACVTPNSISLCLPDNPCTSARVWYCVMGVYMRAPLLTHVRVYVYACPPPHPRTCIGLARCQGDRPPLTPPRLRRAGGVSHHKSQPDCIPHY